MLITRKSMISGKVRTLDVDVTQEQVLTYLRGTMIQDAFPHLSAADREFIMTGITAEEWVNTFGNEDENDE